MRPFGCAVTKSSNTSGSEDRDQYCKGTPVVLIGHTPCLNSLVFRTCIKAFQKLALATLALLDLRAHSYKKNFVQKILISDTFWTSQTIPYSHLRPHTERFLHENFNMLIQRCAYNLITKVIWLCFWNGECWTRWSLSLIQQSATTEPVILCLWDDSTDLPHFSIITKAVHLIS